MSKHTDSSKWLADFKKTEKFRERQQKRAPEMYELLEKLANATLDRGEYKVNVQDVQDAQNLLNEIGDE